MNCTRCTLRIQKEQKYRRTKLGAHHVECQEPCESYRPYLNQYCLHCGHDKVAHPSAMPPSKSAGNYFRVSEVIDNKDTVYFMEAFVGRGWTQASDAHAHEETVRAWRDRLALAAEAYAEARNKKMVEALTWIAAQRDFTFAECTLAEEIIGRASAAIAGLPNV